MYPIRTISTMNLRVLKTERIFIFFTDKIFILQVKKKPDCESFFRNEQIFIMSLFQMMGRMDAMSSKLDDLEKSMVAMMEQADDE